MSLGPGSSPAPVRSAARQPHKCAAPGDISLGSEPASRRPPSTSSDNSRSPPPCCRRPAGAPWRHPAECSHAARSPNSGCNAARHCRNPRSRNSARCMPSRKAKSILAPRIRSGSRRAKKLVAGNLIKAAGLFLAHERRIEVERRIDRNRPTRRERQRAPGPRPDLEVGARLERRVQPRQHCQILLAFVALDDRRRQSR